MKWSGEKARLGNLASGIGKGTGLGNLASGMKWSGEKARLGNLASGIINKLIFIQGGMRLSYPN